MESRAVACDFQQCGIPTRADPDEPAQPPPSPPPRLRTQMTPRQQPNSHITLKRQAKAPIRLRACAGWSKALLVAQTPPSEIPCTGSDNIYRKKQKANNSKAKQSKSKAESKKIKLGTTQRASTSKTIPSPEQPSELRV